jgi:hypothetical protein
MARAASATTAIGIIAGTIGITTTTATIGERFDCELGNGEGRCISALLFE